MASRMSSLAAIVCLGLAGFVAAEVAAAPSAPAGSGERDAFLSGYAAAVLERELKVKVESLTVIDGTVTVNAPDLSPVDRQQIVRVLSTVDGVASVKVTPSDQTPLSLTTTPPVPRLAAPIDSIVEPSATAAPMAVGWMPGGNLFDPLLADPRWPHMGASYQQYTNHDLAQNTAAVSLGGSIAFYRDDLADGGQWELAMQGGVFALFDLDAVSEDLLNADYLVGPTLTWKWDDLSILARLFHQSSHLGDEFLLANPGFDRENYSFEAFDAIVSHDFDDGTIRLYGGGRGRFNTDPGDLDHWSIQYGAEWQSRRTFLADHLRPIAALDIQHHEQNNWEADVSVRAGVQLKGPESGGHALQLLAEYYNGHSPHGQFFGDRVRFVGVGAHFYY